MKSHSPVVFTWGVHVIRRYGTLVFGSILVIILYWGIESAQAQTNVSTITGAAPTTGNSAQKMAEIVQKTAPQGFAPVPGLPILTVTDDANGQQDYSVTLQVLLLMTALSFIPALLMTMTSFTRIIIVFSILRQALGLQQSPSNQILIGLSLFLEGF